MTGTIFKVAMAAGLVATLPTGGTTELWAQWGLAGLVVAFVLWSNHIREKRMTAMIETNSRWIRETLLGALDKNTTALDKAAKALERGVGDRREIRS